MNPTPLTDNAVQAPSDQSTGDASQAPANAVEAVFPVSMALPNIDPFHIARLHFQALLEDKWKEMETRGTPTAEDFDEIAQLSKKIFYINSASHLQFMIATPSSPQGDLPRPSFPALTTSTSPSFSNGPIANPAMYGGSLRVELSTPERARISAELHAALDHSTTDLEADGPVTKARKEAFTKHWFSRLLLHLTAAVTLIAPMLIMSIEPSLVKSLVTSSVFIVVFAIGVAMSTYFGDGESITATAAYAAVLFVFVGASLGQSGSLG